MEKLCAKQHAVDLDTLGEGQLLSRLAEEGEWPARAVVSSQPNAFLASVLEEYGEHKETEAAIAWMTSFSELREDDALMEDYAASLEGAPVADISVLPTRETIELFVRYERVQPSFSNALKLFIFNGYQISDGVVHLLSQAQDKGVKLTRAAAQMEYSDLLLHELARDEGISKGLLSWVAKAFVKDGITLSDGSIPGSSLAVLIEAHAISMSAKSLWHIRKYYDELLVSFVLSRFKEYIGLLKGDDSCLDEQEVLRMINSGKLKTGKQRLDLLNCLPEGTRIALDEISYPPESITSNIVRHFFDPRDLLLLDGLYANAKTNELKDAVVDCCIEHVEDILERCAPLNIALLSRVLSDPVLTGEQREGLISIACEDWSYEEYCQLFKAANLDIYLRSLTKPGRRRVRENRSSAALLRDMDEKDFISSYSEAKDGYYVVNAKRAHP